MDQQQPNILEVVEPYTSLKQVGREYVGICPLHVEKTASFTVNEEKQVFYCHGCHEGGDIIEFIKKIEGVDFKGALSILGLSDSPKPTKSEITERERLKRASKNLSTWAMGMADRIGERMREIGQHVHMARKVLRELPEADRELLEGEIKRASREWEILTMFQEDLLNPETVMDLWRGRGLIKKIAGDEDPYRAEELEGVFPPLTDEYRQRIKSYVEGCAA